MISPEIIMREVSEYYKVYISLLIGKNRTQKVADCRHIAIYLTKSLCPKMTLQSIGNLYGKRHHSSIIHSINEVKSGLESKDLEYAQRLKEDIDSIRTNIKFVYENDVVKIPHNFFQYSYTYTGMMNYLDT